MRDRIIKWAFFAGIFIIWQCIAWSGAFPPNLLPGPLQVLNSLGVMSRDGTIFTGAGVSMFRLIGDYFVAVGGGIIIGVFISRFEWMEGTIGALTLGLQTLPTICWLPMAVIWFGASEKAIFSLVVLGGILSVILATEAGVRHVPVVLIRAARSMGASGFQLYRRVIIPAAFPAIISGLKQGWAFSWRTLMAAELLFGDKGLGYLLQTGRKDNDTSRFLAVILVMLVLGITVELAVFRPLEKKVRGSWGLS